MKTLLLLLLAPLTLAFSQNIKVTDNLLKCGEIVSDDLDDLKQNTWYHSTDESIGTVYVYRVIVRDGIEKIMAELETLLTLNDKKFKSPDIDESIGEFNPKKLKKSAEEIEAGGMYVKKVWFEASGEQTGDYIMMVSETGILQLVVMDVK